MTVTALELRDASRILRDALKDKRYRATPLGLEVARYIRWKRTEWGARPDTIRDYEPILAKLALFFSDLGLEDFTPPIGTERLRECWDHHWGELSPRTRSKVRSVWVDFFDWSCRERGLTGNPARVLASPKRRDPQRELFGPAFVLKVIASQEYLADKLGCILILQYALRRAELAGVKFGDFDFERRRLTITGKGGKVRIIPIVDEPFWRDLAALQLELQAPSHHSLIYRTRQVGMTLFRYHERPVAPRSVNSWWYRCVARAGYVDADRDSGTWKGFNMHRGRHTVATDILRKTGNIVAAQKLLGHESIETTVRTYARFDDEDLERVLRAMHEADAE